MAVNRQWVKQVEGVLAEIRPGKELKSTQEREAHQAFARYEFDSPGFAVKQTPKARADREIRRIAKWYGWNDEIARALDLAGADSLEALPLAETDQLVDRMKLLEDCVQTGGDAPDAPPAR